MLFRSGQEQTPAVQVEPKQQLLPHIPQLLLLVCRFTQKEPPPPPPPPPPVQRVWPVGQEQTPAVQVEPKPQLMPHIPQLLALVCRLTH